MQNRKYRTVPTQVVQHEKLVKEWTTCDCCGEDVRSGLDLYEESEVNIEATIGNRYNIEDDFRSVYKMDCCKKCFLEKILPLLKSVGAVREYSLDDGDTPIKSQEN